MKKPKLFPYLLSLLILFSFIGSAYAITSIPQIINYQGVLTDRNGVRRNGNFDIRFSIWDNPTLTDAATHKVWPASDGDEHSGIPVRRGMFSLFIGGGSASGTLTETVFAHIDGHPDERYLQLEVSPAGQGAYEKLLPRTKITSVAYAFSAAGIHGRYGTGNIFPSHGDVGIGTMEPQAKLDVRGDTYFSGNVGVGTTEAVQKLDVRGDTYFSGNVGIGTTEPTADLHVEGNLRVTGTIEGASPVKVVGGLNVLTGNVGVGTTEAIQKLDVRGDTYFSGNVGIGTVEPQAKLEVAGTIIADEPTASNHVVTMGYVDAQIAGSRTLQCGFSATTSNGVLGGTGDAICAGDFGPGWTFATCQRFLGNPMNQSSLSAWCNNGGCLYSYYTNGARVNPIAMGGGWEMTSEINCALVYSLACCNYP